MTTGRELYLKQNVQLEPLFNQWYAWSSLISPATAAMFVANSHLKIMQSFTASPQMHVSALKNPAMRGGPFINYDASRAPAVRDLIDKTVKEQARLLELSAAIQKLSEMLDAEAGGLSLEPLYAKIPETLRGYVELVYDLNNNPSIRFIEGLLYKSPFYDESAQSIALSLVDDEERPFALSTPVLEGNGRLHLKIPFSSAQIDELFKMKHDPQPLDRIKEVLGVGDEDAELFSSYFTEEAPPPAPRYEGDGVRIRYFGHACVLIESKDVSILIDPLISYKYDSEVTRYTYADLPERIDYVLITHNHQDHCMFETLLQLRHRVEHVIVPKNNGGGLVDPSLKLVLQNIGFKQVREIDELESIEIPGGAIMGLPFLGEHADLNIRTKIAYLLTLQGRSVLCAADSNNIEPRLYEHLHRLTGDVDVIFIGMECDGGPLSWLYGPLLTKPLARKQDQSRRLNGSNYDRGADLVKRFNPKQVYVYAMGQEPWLTYLTSIQYTDESSPIVESNKLVTDCRERGIESERLFGHKEILL
ncbi:MAG: MBL fold metallo-hydrolase [Acidobacteria bacterium]|nr:MBL fold metallo-hydrolase [Acidobacteriota bacterium]